jgi:TRAP-type transport system periplasmic protein
MKVSRPVLLLLAVIAALPAGCDSSANKATGASEVEPVVLTLANWQRGDSDVGEWAQTVERLSDGAIQIEIRGRWRKGEIETDSGTLSDVRAGKVDIGHIAARAWDTLGVDDFQPLDAPMLIDSLALQERVITSELGPAMLASVEDAGVQPLALLPGPLRHPAGITDDLIGPDDYRGALIGARPAALQQATMAALGARVREMLSAGRLDDLDGIDVDLAAADHERYDGQAESITADVVLWPRVTTLVMNTDTWDELTDGQREVLEEAARAAIEPSMRRERRLARGANQSLCDRGFRLVRAGADGRAALRRAVEPVYSRLERSESAGAALERIRSLKEDVPPAPMPSCDAADGETEANVDERVVGSWFVHVSREEIAAAPRLTGERIFDNWGGITLVLEADGSFEMLNDRYPDGPIGTGSWTSRGDVLVFTPGGDLTMGAGETWRYRRTLFRGSLVLRRLSKDAGPTALMIAPLRPR